VIALFFDTETTGFKSSTFTPEIVQIGALLQDMSNYRVLSELNLIITAQAPIPQVVSDIHGIDDEISRKYGVDTTVAETMFAMLAEKADVIVAHNIEFDLGIIEGMWPNASAVLAERKQFCTMKRATDVIKLPAGKYHGKSYSTYKPPKLIEAYQHFYEGASFENAHDAMADVRACRDVFVKLIPELKAS
jgi:DNA polymerase-3 subunit epsilon